MLRLSSNTSADSLKAEERLRKAMEYYEKALSVSSTDSLTLIGISDACVTLGEYEKAESYLRTAVNVYPSSEGAHKELGDVYLAMEKYDLAVVSYRKAIDLNPEYMDAYGDMLSEGLARALFMTKDFEGLVELMFLALEIDPNTFGCHHLQLGLMCLDPERKAQYEEEYNYICQGQ